jgi:hypothetical protein
LALVARLAHARACRFAYVVGRASELPPSTYVASQRPVAPKIHYEAVVTNKRATPVQLVDLANGDHLDQLIPACTWVRINPVSRELPWWLGYRLSPVDVAEAMPIRSLGSDAAGMELGFKITFQMDGSVSVVEQLPVSAAVSDKVC